MVTSEGYKTLLFDLDGTLLDSRLSVIEATYKVASSYLPGKLTFGDINRRFGETFSSFVEFTGLQHLHDEMLDSYMERVKKNHNLLVKPYPFVKEGLIHLHRLGYQLGIVTNKERQLAEMGLDLLQTTDLFQAIVCIEDVKTGKPEAEPILKAMSIIQSNPKETVMIGDTAFDIRAAVRAGVASVHLQHEECSSANPFQATYCFRDFYGFVSFLEDLHKRKEEASLCRKSF